MPPASATPSPDPDAARALKATRREARRKAEASRGLDPWERYRALTDAIEEGLDLAEMADRKVRFALVVMAGINVGLLAVTSRPELLGFGRTPMLGWFGLYLLVYALAGVNLFLRAVEALRPAEAPPPAGDALSERGLRDPSEVIRHDDTSYEQAWADVRFDQLNRELARRNRALALHNEAKYGAVRRLYGGLRMLAVLFGGLVVMVAVSTLSGGGQP